MATLTFHYIFGDGEPDAKHYEVVIDEATLSVIPERHETPPEWARLTHHQCENCPLNPEEHPYCPVAANIAHVAEEFHDQLSYDQKTVKVIAPERTYVKSVPLQYGIFSIFGLIMATSDCPHMRFLKPMARFHLPFASSTETIVRTVSMFLLRQYLRSKTRHQTDFDLSALDEAYASVNLVNKGMVGRIRSITTGDADANAIIILHSLATLLSQSLSDNLAEIEPIFSYPNAAD
jgi:hypothetical protein